jgi:tetratricopeptide (TPR) repeat protein
MSDAAVVVVPSEATLQQLRDVVNAVQQEQFERVVELCQRLRDNSADVEVAAKELHPVLDEVRLVALLQCERYDEAMAVANACISGESNNEISEFGQRMRALSAYALYKQKRYPLIVQMSRDKSNSDDGTGDTTALLWQHLRAQSLFHSGHGTEALRCYQDLVTTAHKSDSVDDGTVQSWTNLLAVCLANHTTPYCRAQSNDETIELNRLVDAMVRYLHTLQPSANGDYPYDLAYNLATWQLLTASSSSERTVWLELLDTAMAACRQATASWSSASEMANELGPLLSNQALFQRVYWHWTTSSDAARAVVPEPRPNPATAGSPTTALALVHCMNQSMGLSHPQEALLALDEAINMSNNASVLTPLQRRIWFYNRAVLQLYAAMYEECRATCQTYFPSTSTLPNTKNGKKKKTEEDNLLAFSNLQDALFWQCRASVLLAHCARKSGMTTGSVAAILDPCLEAIRSAPPSNVRDHCLTYTLLHQAQLQSAETTSSPTSDCDSKIKLLDSLPESVAHKPAVLATKAALYQLSGQHALATQLLSQNNAENDLAMADFAMSQGNHDEAAALYEKLVQRNVNDVAAKARWVRALSYSNPEQAMQVWSAMAPDLVEEEMDGDGEAVNGAELEARELRLKSATNRKLGDGLTDQTVTKKSHEAVLRRRARQRQAYLAQLEQKAPTASSTVPDPERWIPKYERTNARRRRRTRNQPRVGGGTHQGGGVSEKEAAKLDILARQAARADGAQAAAAADPNSGSGSRSTAHLTAGATRTKAKGSKRR